MTPNKEKALVALLTHKTKNEAAAAAGITSRTLRDYFNDPEFQNAYKSAFGNMVEDATRQAQQTINPALSTLREIIEDGEEPATTRVQACKAALEYALRLTEQFDVLEQLKNLEQDIGEE